MLIDSGIKIYACYSTQIYRRLDLHPTSHILLLKRYMGSILLILIFSHSSDNNYTTWYNLWRQPSLGNEKLAVLHKCPSYRSGHLIEVILLRILKVRPSWEVLILLFFLLLLYLGILWYLWYWIAFFPLFLPWSFSHGIFPR